MPGNERSVAATEIKNRFGHFLGEVMHRSQPVFVEKHGEPVAVLVGMALWKELTGAQVSPKSSFVEACRKLSRKIKREGRTKQTPAVELIRELRRMS